MKQISSYNYCRNFVRENDYHLYLLHFFAPRCHRHAILSLMALHTELRFIPHKAEDANLMQIRLKWWMDEVEKTHNGHNHSQSPILANIPAPAIKWHLWQNYFTNFQTLFSGQTADIDSDFYILMTTVITNEKHRSNFTKILMHHDKLQDKKCFRALRLWLGL